MTTTHKGTSKYQKAAVVKELRDASAAVERALKTHEEELAEWRETATLRLAQKIADWGDGKDKFSGSRDWDFPPPSLNQACRDYRIQSLNRCILRVSAMDGDVVALRSDDPIWEFVGLAACL